MIQTRVAVCLLLAAAVNAAGAGRNQLRLSLRTDPKTFDPLLVEEESGDTIRYLTSGVLVRINRVTQQPEPELATSWRMEQEGKLLKLELRRNLCFSDGRPFTSADVVYTFGRMFDASRRSPLADSFQTGRGNPRARPSGPHAVTVELPAPLAGIERLLDQVPILSSRSAGEKAPVLGPYVLSEYKPGSFVLLERNRYYWKRDEAGRRLPYLDSIRLDIQSNRDLEAMRFRRGELDMIAGLDAELYDQLRREPGSPVIDAGPSFDSEMLWFNQSAKSPLPEHKKRWFRSRAFRKAVSHAINRQDIARLVYRGYATPAAGPFTAANKVFYNPKIQPDAWSPDLALRLLASEGFQKRGDALYDRAGNRVAFTVITNAGNKARARIGSLLQQDLRKTGMAVNLVPLDFPSLIERITKTQAYDACLLGLVNVDPDPNAQMNVWLSSGANHQWNPRQPSPETAWEAEIDRLMQEQASSLALEKRRASFNRVQEIIAEQAPFIYLVSRNSLVAARPELGGVSPSPLRPQLYWNVETLYFKNRGRR